MGNAAWASSENGLHIMTHSATGSTVAGEFLVPLQGGEALQI